MGIKPGRDPMKDIRNFLMAIQKKADAIIEKIPKFTFEAFEEEFGITQTEKFDVFSNFQRYINKLENEGRVGTAMSYRNGYKSLKEFSGKPNLDFNSITPDFLHKYERWMLENGRQLTTVGIYLRSLRVLINLAISKGIFDRNQYPFGKHRYVIPAGRNIKKALTAAELEKIIKYPAIQGSPLEKA